MPVVFKCWPTGWVHRYLRALMSFMNGRHCHVVVEIRTKGESDYFVRERNCLDPPKPSCPSIMALSMTISDSLRNGIFHLFQLANLHHCFFY